MEKTPAHKTSDRPPPPRPPRFESSPAILTPRSSRRWTRFIATKRSLYRLLALAAIFAIASVVAYFTMVRMPGRSFTGPLPPLSASQSELSARLRVDVEALASGIGKRSTLQPRQMALAARHIIAQLQLAGYPEHEESFVERNARTPNIIVEIKGTTRPDEIVLVGAHYDSYAGTPGADDNASGVAAVLELARAFRAQTPTRTIRLAFFVNEEPPSFQTADMGSWVYAKACRARKDNIVAMISLETIGFYTDEIGYQKYPPLVGAFYPEKGNFIAFVGNVSSRDLVRTCIKSFRTTASFPSQGAALPGNITGVGWSDHWAFWQEGYPAIMVTDTAPFRNPHYHIESDRPDTLDFDSMARVVEGLGGVVRSLAN